MRVDDDASASAPEATSALAGATGKVLRWPNVAEHLGVLLLGLLVLGVHDVGYLLRAPFWTDEAWVAVTTRFPLSQLPATTSSTPIGWSALLRLFPAGGAQTSRLLPLAFAGAAVMIAYWFARRLGWRWPAASVAAGLLAAIGVLLMPAMLVRNDLKQYTADAATALLTLALTSQLEREWSRRRLAVLSVAIWGGMLFSHTVTFVGIAAFAAVCVVQLARRAWRRLIEAAVAGAGTAVLMLGVYVVFDARAVVPGLTAYWSGYYLPAARGLHASATFVTARFDAVHGYFGLGPAWLAVPLVIAGLVTIFRLGRPATAVAIALLWPLMLTLSALRKYPFLDLRTSTFLLAVTVAVAAIGVAGVCSLLRSWLRGRVCGAGGGVRGAGGGVRGVRGVREVVAGLVAAALAAGAVAGFAVGAWPRVRSHEIPREDVRDQARYVASHAAPADVIVVNLNSNWGFAYYWRRGQPARRPDAAVLQGYEAYFPGQPRIVVARNRDAAGVDAALAQALRLAGPQSCARIWLVRAHVNSSEKAAWAAALRGHRLSSQWVGHGGLRVVRTGGRGC
ncbi:MAG TPA: hypothetical protein VMV07_02995 [Streptosporangiaceae bacterium]|nr:hypothetical protein [Streptosporangiaceae bacterium]